MNKYNINFDAHIADCLANEDRPLTESEKKWIAYARIHSPLIRPPTEEELKDFWGDDYQPKK